MMDCRGRGLCGWMVSWVVDLLAGSASRGLVLLSVVVVVQNRASVQFWDGLWLGGGGGVLVAVVVVVVLLLLLLLLLNPKPSKP